MTRLQREVDGHVAAAHATMQLTSSMPAQERLMQYCSAAAWACMQRCELTVYSCLRCMCASSPDRSCSSRVHVLIVMMRCTAWHCLVSALLPLLAYTVFLTCVASVWVSKHLNPLPEGDAGLLAAHELDSMLGSGVSCARLRQQWIDVVSAPGLAPLSHDALAGALIASATRNGRNLTSATSLIMARAQFGSMPEYVTRLVGAPARLRRQQLQYFFEV